MCKSRRTSTAAAAVSRHNRAQVALTVMVQNIVVSYSPGVRTCAACAAMQQPLSARTAQGAGGV